MTHLRALDLTPLPRRLAQKINPNGGLPVEPLRPVAGECWLIDTWLSGSGYPWIRFDGRDQSAHRAVYVGLGGHIPSGYDLDHVCRNRLCVNPGHMEPVTHAENQRRLSQAQKSCRRSGHDWTDPRNVYVRKNGRRFCAECSRIDQRKARAERNRMKEVA